MNKTIYFADKAIRFVSEEHNTKTNEASTLFINLKEGETMPLEDIIESLKSYDNITLLCTNIDSAWSEMTKQFKAVTAAGGVVINPLDEMLMINRFSRWDLPKGHLESGESLEECALREVEEETGVTPLTLGRKLGVTYHSYQKGGAWELKATYWWAMQSSQTSQPTPQSEEGIVAAEWIAPQKVSQLTEGSFPTIKSVIHSFQS